MSLAYSQTHKHISSEQKETGISGTCCIVWFIVAVSLEYAKQTCTRSPVCITCSNQLWLWCGKPGNSVTHGRIQKYGCTAFIKRCTRSVTGGACDHSDRFRLALLVIVGQCCDGSRMDEDVFVVRSHPHNLFESLNW